MVIWSGPIVSRLVARVQRRVTRVHISVLLEDTVSLLRGPVVLLIFMHMQPYGVVGSMFNKARLLKNNAILGVLRDIYANSQLTLWAMSLLARLVGISIRHCVLWHLLPIYKVYCIMHKRYYRIIFETTG